MAQWNPTLSQLAHLQTQLFDVCDSTPVQLKQLIICCGLCSKIPQGLLDVIVDSDHHKYQYIARHISFTSLKNIWFNYTVNWKKLSAEFSYRYSSYFISAWWILPHLQFIIIHDTQVDYKNQCWSTLWKFQACELMNPSISAPYSHFVMQQYHVTLSAVEVDAKIL